MRFDTAGSVPEPIFKAIAEQYPSLTLTGYAFDELWRFAAAINVKNGSALIGGDRADTRALREGIRSRQTRSRTIPWCNRHLGHKKKMMMARKTKTVEKNRVVQRVLQLFLGHAVLAGGPAIEAGHQTDYGF